MMIGEVAELTSAKRGFPVTPPAAVSPAGSLLAKQAHQTAQVRLFSFRLWPLKKTGAVAPSFAKDQLMVAELPGPRVDKRSPRRAHDRPAVVSPTGVVNQNRGQAPRGHSERLFSFGGRERRRFPSDRS
jgi:hypothetical protein